MKKNDFIIHIQGLYAKCIETLKAKNSDYSNDNSDPFHNFKLCEHAFGIPTEIGIMVRLGDKFARTGNLIQKSLQGKTSMVKDESLLDAIEDAINYMAILHALIQSKDAAQPRVVESDDDSELTERMIEQAEVSEAPEYNPNNLDDIEDLFKFNGKRWRYKDTDNFYITPNADDSYKCHYLVDLNQRFVSNWDLFSDAMIECHNRFKEYQKRIRAE